MGTVLAFLFVFYVALPLVASHRAEVAALTHIHPAYLALGVLLELAALVAYTQLTHAVLPPGGPRRLRLFRINLSTLSLSHVAPGGTAPGAALGYRLLTQSGVSSSDAGFALGTQGIGSAVVLNALFWLALAGFLAVHGFHVPADRTGGGSPPGSILVMVAAGVGMVLLAAFAGLLWLVTRGPERAHRVARRVGRRLRLVDPDRLVALVEGLAQRFSDLVADRSLTRRAVGWAAANWLLDAASLWVFIAAFGHSVSPVDLLTAYGLANILAAIPLTPAGLGVVELVLVSMITGFGPTAGQALSGSARLPRCEFLAAHPGRWPGLRLARTRAPRTAAAMASPKRGCHTTGASGAGRCLRGLVHLHGALPSGPHGTAATFDPASRHGRWPHRLRQRAQPRGVWSADRSRSRLTLGTGPS